MTKRNHITTLLLAALLCLCLAPRATAQEKWKKDNGGHPLPDGTGLTYYSQEAGILGPLRRLSLAASFGTAGRGGMVSVMLNEKFTFRVGLESAHVHATREIDLAADAAWKHEPLDVYVKYDALEASVLLDRTYGKRRNFWLSAGIMFGTGVGRLRVQTQPLPIPRESMGTADIGGADKTITTDYNGVASGHADVNKAKPYLGLGWRFWLGRDNRRSAHKSGLFGTLEAGAAFWGKPRLQTYDYSSGTPAVVEGVTSADLRGFDGGLADKLRSMPVMPVLRLTIGFEHIM